MLRQPASKSAGSGANRKSGLDTVGQAGPGVVHVVSADGKVPKDNSIGPANDGAVSSDALPVSVDARLVSDVNPVPTNAITESTDIRVGSEDGKAVTVVGKAVTVVDKAVTVVGKAVTVVGKEVTEDVKAAVTVDDSEVTVDGKAASGKPRVSSDSDIRAIPTSSAVDPIDGFGIAESDTIKNSRKWSLSQRYYEYVNYISNIPKLIASDKTKLKAKIEEVLGFRDLKDMKLGEVNFNRCSGTPILNSYSISHGISLK